MANLDSTATIGDFLEIEGALTSVKDSDTTKFENLCLVY